MSEFSAPLPAIAWQVAPVPVPYEQALAVMEERVAAIRAGTASELLWLLEHPPLYTAGTGARPEDLLMPHRFPVHEAGRGGQYTYHGPGQRVVYAMIDLRHHGADLRGYIRLLERWIVETLAALGIVGELRDGRVGVWVTRQDGGEDKIAAIGVRVRRWVAFHGISLNVAPDLGHFTGIVPCGIKDHGVTSLAALGVAAGMDEIDRLLLSRFERVFDRRLTPSV